MHLHQNLHHNEKNGSWCKIMGSITARKSADGSVSYRAAIRINKKGYPA
ncbi:integrase, partial [Acinetobacter baumannii]